MSTSTGNAWTEKRKLNNVKSPQSSGTSTPTNNTSSSWSNEKRNSVAGTKANGEQPQSNAWANGSKRNSVQGKAPDGQAPGPTTGNAWTERRNSAKVKVQDGAKPGQAPSGNAWADRASKSNSSPNGRPAASSQQGGIANAAAGPKPGEVRHVPVNNFNSNDIKDYFRKSFQKATTGDTSGASVWKAADQSGNPWGGSPNLMANKQDFWHHLNKQLSSQQQGGGG